MMAPIRKLALRRRFDQAPAVLLISASLFSGGCKAGVGELDHKTVVVLLDLSESTDDPPVRDSYCRNFQKVAASITHGDALLAGWITSQSSAELELPVNKLFAEVKPPSDNRLIERGFRAKADTVLLDSLQAVTTRICEQLRAQRRVWHTDIIGSIGLARRIFEALPKPRKILVLMSDMIEDSEHYNFAKLELSPQTISEVIKREREAGRLPALGDVRVYVVGAAAGSISRLDRIRDFWTTYFDSTGAELAYYGGPFVSFPE